MYKEHLLQNIERELDLLQRLAALIEEKDLHFSPGEKVRTTHELMQYLSDVGYVVVRWMAKSDMGPDERKAVREANAHVSIQDFPQRLEAQREKIRDVMNQVKEEDLFTQEATMPWGEKMLLGPALMNTSIKFLASYRMQLFLNLKLNGRPELGTREAWVMNQPAATTH